MNVPVERGVIRGLFSVSGETIPFVFGFETRVAE
jgi:hypothetical protein